MIFIKRKCTSYLHNHTDADYILLFSVVKLTVPTKLVVKLAVPTKLVVASEQCRMPTVLDRAALYKRVSATLQGMQINIRINILTSERILQLNRSDSDSLKAKICHKFLLLD
jgi:hypothetical protein